MELYGELAALMATKDRETILMPGTQGVQEAIVVGGELLD